MQKQSPRAVSTAGGLAAILLWSTTFAFSRSLMEQVGVFAGAGAIYLTSGAVGCAVLLLRGRLGNLRRLPAWYLLGGGGLFVVRCVSLYMASGFAANRQQLVEVSIINYLWPGLTIALSVPMLGRRARWYLWPAVGLGFCGVVLAPMNRGGLDPGVLLENLRLHPWPYVLGLMAAVGWAVYSNLTCKLGDSQAGGAVAPFVLGTGLALAGLGLVFPAPSHWTGRAALELAHMALLVVLLSYSLWEGAMRRGRTTLVLAASYFTPLLSMVVSCLYLGIPMRWPLWAACGFIIAGAFLSNRAIVEREPRPQTVEVETEVAASRASA